MMKHIKKKTVDYIKFKPEDIQKFDGLMFDIPNGKIPKLKSKDVKDKEAFLLMESGEMLRSFFYNDNGTICTIPLANPVLIYFNSAQANLRNIDYAKKELLKQFKDSNDTINENSLHLFYNFFGLTSGFIVLLMTALEAFINQKLKVNEQYEKSEGKKFIKVYDHHQIQRWVPFEEKITEILNKQTGKNFSKHYPPRQIHIDNLKNLRDDIIHTKKGAAYDNYTDLFKKSLSFKFNDAIEAVRDFINYYEPNLIEPCPCNSDF